MKKKTFNVSGMFCSACVGRVEKAASSVSGVSKAEVSLLTNSLSVSFSDETSTETICNAVKKAGYGCSVELDSSVISRRKTRSKEFRLSLTKILIGGVFALIIMYFGMGGMWGWPSFSPVINKSLQLAFCSAVILLYFPLLYKGIKDLVFLHPGMESLVALGSGISYGYSLYIYIMFLLGTDLGVPLFFDGAAMIPLLVSLGKLLEFLAKSKTTSSLEDLLALTPETASLLVNDSFILTRAEDLKPGDVCLVRQGERIPADGTIIDGDAHIEEAMLTGEALPAFRSLGDNVLSGSIDIAGTFKMVVSKTRSDSSLAKITELIRSASLSKGKLSLLADRISGIFVPVIILIAITVYLCWRFTSFDSFLSIRMGISVLLVACPCALGLATPVAIMVGSGRAAKEGILIKDARVFETLAKTSSLILDKTGTLTTGHLKIFEFEIEKNHEEYLDAIYSLESLSIHPLAWSIALYLKEKGRKTVEITDYTNYPGLGIGGFFQGTSLLIGNEKLMEEKNILLNKAEAKELKKRGSLITFIAIKDKVVGYFSADDETKSEANGLVKAFSRLGVSLTLATGDSLERAQAFGDEVGIKNIHGQVTPEDKIALMKSFQKKGTVVAMVGDGINDAPALKAADCGIAIGTGSDLAAEAGDAILIDGSLRSLLSAFVLSKKVETNIKMNLFWAFFYNLVGIPIAAGAFHYVGNGFDLSPMLASAMMALSSLCVILNALRLKNVKLVDKSDIH